ncbi:MAG: hypothetical protein EPN76_14010 [Burkholderiaceae bacterium]|nr:MAG: hypothetical protein EPN76_14010 [Burkholderiaceae bacterium]
MSKLVGGKVEFCFVLDDVAALISRQLLLYGHKIVVQLRKLRDVGRLGPRISQFRSSERSVSTLDVAQNWVFESQIGIGCYKPKIDTGDFTFADTNVIGAPDAQSGYVECQRLEGIAQSMNTVFHKEISHNEIAVSP